MSAEKKIPNRRQFLTIGGVTLLGSTFMNSLPFNGLNKAAAGFLGIPPAQAADRDPADPLTMPHSFNDLNKVVRGTKPVYLPYPGSKDPVAHSLAENIFWVDIMMEHAKFLTMFLPGKELSSFNLQAERFQNSFYIHLRKITASNISEKNFVALNNETIRLIRPFREFKMQLMQLQTSGRIHSLAYPSFFHHIIEEADRAMNRLRELSSRQIEQDREVVAKFWLDIMKEHTELISHLLDPVEKNLIAQVYQKTQALQSLTPITHPATLVQIGEDIIAFKVEAEKGILSGKIKSIIHPTLADHVVREAVKFQDEVKRLT